MSYSKIIRRILALSLTAVVLFLALASASYPIYIEALQQLSIPFAVVLGGYFSKDIIDKYKKKQMD